MDTYDQPWHEAELSGGVIKRGARKRLARAVKDIMEVKGLSKGVPLTGSSPVKVEDSADAVPLAGSVEKSQG